MILNGLSWKRTEVILSFFEISSKYCILDSCVDSEGYSISSKGFFPTVVSELKSPIPVHFSLLIPKMLMLTLAISCLKLKVAQSCLILCDPMD